MEKRKQAEKEQMILEEEYRQRRKMTERLKIAEEERLKREAEEKKRQVRSQQ
jgi:hypothetical protein